MSPKTGTFSRWPLLTVSRTASNLSPASVLRVQSVANLLCLISMMSWGGRVTKAHCPPMTVPSGLFIVFVNKYEMSYACAMLGKCWVVLAIPLWASKQEKNWAACMTFSEEADEKDNV